LAAAVAAHVADRCLPVRRAGVLERICSKQLQSFHGGTWFATAEDGATAAEEDEMRAFGYFTIVALATLIPVGISQAAISGLTRVATGVSSPIFVTHAPGDRSRLFIAERGGGIRILNLETGTLEAMPFLTMSGVSTDGEGGFLGLAFHPNYFNQGQPGYGKFYVNVTTNFTTQTHIREFEVFPNNPNVADPGSLREILSFAQPQTNHNGGWLGFSPNNQYLYIATGDGGGGFDGGDGSGGHTSGTGNAQDTSSLLGKMLRIDPIDPDPMNGLNYAIPPSNPFVGIAGADEIWDYGLRNPFRSSFDRTTGDLWIGDVGQNQREEIDFHAAAIAGGKNFGWRYREGTVQTQVVGTADSPAFTSPVYDYARPLSNPNNDPAITEMNKYRGTVVTGGYVYRGSDPSLQGQYFFMDSRNSGGTSDDNYWKFNPANPSGTVTNINSLLTANAGTHQFPASFGEDAVGNLYIAYLFSGEVYRVATAHIAGDYDYDGDVDQSDYDLWRKTLNLMATTAPADGNGNGVVDAADYVVWRKNRGTSLGSGAAAEVPETRVVIYLLQIISLLVVRSLFARHRPSRFDLPHSWPFY
jgi:glucose/arabinose dehydrogenase